MSYFFVDYRDGPIVFWENFATMRHFTVLQTYTYKNRVIIIIIGRKITVWIFQATNWQDFTREDAGIAKEGKPQKRN